MERARAMPEKNISYIEKYWGKLCSLPPAYLLIGGLCYWSCFSETVSEGYITTPWLRWVLFGVCLIAAFSYTWFCIRNHRLPVAPAGKLAVLFVVDTESDKSFKSIEYKLFKEFQDLVSANAGHPDIVARCVPEKRVSKYNLHNEEDAINLLKTTNCLFLVDVKYKADDDTNAENFEMRINCGVVHPKFDKAVELGLAKDLTNLGKSVQNQYFVKKSLLPTFRITAQTLSYICQYTFGFVLLFSKYVLESKTIFENLQSKIAGEASTSAIKLLKELLPLRLYAVYIYIAEKNIIDFQRNNDLGFLLVTQEALTKANELISDTYAYNLEMAYVAIALNQDYRLARSCIEKCKNWKKEGSWRYSDAFLCAYNGNSGVFLIKFKTK